MFWLFPTSTYAALLNSTWFRTFSITIEKHLTMGGSVIARWLQTPVMSFVRDTNTSGKAIRPQW